MILQCGLEIKFLSPYILRITEQDCTDIHYVSHTERNTIKVVLNYILNKRLSLAKRRFTKMKRVYQKTVFYYPPIFERQKQKRQLCQTDSYTRQK